MKCEVKNIQSAEVFSIPPEGMIFGRAGGPANITVSDQSVSKRHARIFNKEGQWLLEDLKSVNGTVVNNRRITEPVAVTPGFVFALSKHQFEIVSVDGASSTRSAMKSPNGNGNGESDPRARGAKSSAPQPPAQSPRRGAGGPSGQPVPVPDAEPLLPPEPSRSRSQVPPPADDSDMPGQQNDPYLDEMESAGQGGGAGAVIAALPKAIAYYLAAVPLMALNPIGAVRRGVENPKLKAMVPLELIAFFLPVMVFSGVMNAWAAGLSTLIAGGGFMVMAFIPIGPLIGGVIGAIIGGLLTHPLYKFFVERVFKGETDEKTRTNAAIMNTTALALLVVPQALTALLTGVIARLAASFSAAALLLIIPALLTAVTSPLMPYIGWMWFKAWRTAAWAQKLMLVLVVLSALGGLAGCVSTILGAVHMMHGGGGGTVVVDDEAVKKAQADAQKLLDEAKKNGDSDAKPPKGDDAKPPKGDDAKPPKGDDAKPPKGDDAKPPKGDDAKPPKGDDAKPPKADDTPAAPEGKGYPEYKRKRDVVEKMITDDPTLLNRRGKSGDVRALYTVLSNCTYKGVSDAEEEVLGRKKKYDPGLKLLLDHVKDQKIYERCAPTVDQLYKALPHD